LPQLLQANDRIEVTLNYSTTDFFHILFHSSSINHLTFHGRYSELLAEINNVLSGVRGSGGIALLFLDLYTIG
jgi:hypothetical protein